MARTGKPSRQSGFAEGRTSGSKRKSTRDPVASHQETYDKSRKLLSAVVDDMPFDEIDQDKLRDENRFARQFRRLRKKAGADNDHFNADVINRLMLRAMLSMVLDVIPIAEKAYRSSSKENAAYALNSLLNQARELAMDLRLSKDTVGQAEFISSKILKPVFVSFTQVLIAELFTLKATIDTEVAPKPAKAVKRQVDAFARALGTFQTSMMDKVSTDIEAFLNGTLHMEGSPKQRNKPSKKGG